MPESDFIPRLRWLIRVLLAWAVIIVGRLVTLQVVEHDEYKRQAQMQHEKQVEIPRRVEPSLTARQTLARASPSTACA